MHHQKVSNIYVSKSKKSKKLYSEVVPKTVDEYLELIDKFPNQEKKRPNIKSSVARS